MSNVTDKVRVLLADDHAVLREGLSALIERQEDMEVVAQARDGLEAVELCVDRRPDVAVIDLSMPRMSGLAAIEEIRQRSPETRVVVLTMHDNARHLRSALDAGAVGYLVKELVSREILEAIRAAHAGQVFVRMHLANETPPLERDEPGRPAAAEAQVALSQRERQVLRLIARGYTHQEIADALSVGKKSVDSYRARLQQKLGLSRRSDIVRYALASGDLSPDDPDDAL